jgi:uncharacterized protein (DUF427 family)
MSTTMHDLLAGARDRLRHEPIERRIRASADGETVLDSTRAVLVWEPRRVVPTYAVPAEDIHGAVAAAPERNGGADGVLHPGIPFSVHTAPGEPVTIAGREGAGYRLDDEDLGGYVVLDFAAFDGWLEEDDPVIGHPRDPFHRVDVRLTSRPVQIEIGGDVVADTTRARLLFETQIATRFYIPREDIAAELYPSERTTYCPYKGRASYWSLDAGGRRRPDIAWSYEDPLPDIPQIKGLIAFWDERVDVVLDGERRARPGGPIAAALRDEFSV